MSRNVIVGLSVLIVAALGWIIVDAVTPDATPVVGTAVLPVAPVDEAVVGDGAVRVDGTVTDETARVTSEEAADAAADAAERAATAAQDATRAALGPTGAGGAEPVPEVAAPEAGEAAPDAGEAARDAGEAARDAASGASVGVPAAETSAPVAPVTAEPAPEAPDGSAPDLAALLTIEGFEAGPLLDAIEARDLSDPVRANLRAAIEQAGRDPARVPGLVAQLRARFGVE